MAVSQKTNVAGLSIGGGKKENFFFCLLEYFQDKERWFLSGLHQFKEEEFHGRDEVITNWIKDYTLKDLIVDFPLSRPICETCHLECPGSLNCFHEDVVKVRKQIDFFLETDKQIYEQHPKKYEKARLASLEIDVHREVMEKAPTEFLLSKSFKRKLRKGFTPYWNRPVDVFLWTRYYDQMLDLFGVTYDSFGTTSLMLLSRFHYLRRHFPKDLEMFESNTIICLLELLKSKIISKKQLMDFHQIDTKAFARVSIVRSVEKALNLFIYENDIETLGKNQKAFDSFLLALVGQRHLIQKTHNVGDWALGKSAKVVLPNFES